MIEAILVLRKAADDYAGRAARQDVGTRLKAELTDIAAGWHWLAQEAITLCKRGKEFSGELDASCGHCLERCFNQPVLSGRIAAHQIDHQPPAARLARLNLLRLDSAL